MNDISIRYRVNKGFLKDTKTKEVLEIWRKANQKEIDLLGNEDYIIINNLEVVNQVIKQLTNQSSNSIILYNYFINNLNI